jgi:ABC-type multidrug transport system permease subunit
MVAESIMLLVSAVVPVAIVGIALGAMIYGAFMVVQGFFVKLENIGWWWRWMHWVGLDTTFHNVILQSKHQLMTAMLWHDMYA